MGKVIVKHLRYNTDKEEMAGLVADSSVDQILSYNSHISQNLAESHRISGHSYKTFIKEASFSQIG